MNPDQAQREVRALRMLRNGFKPAQVALELGMLRRDVEQLQRDFPGPVRTVAPPESPACTTPRCGESRQGRPPLGWVKVTVAGRGDSLWHCGWTCARRYIDRHDPERAA